MKDIIKLLPDSVANQIAAGEVIQRPASAVKELVENAVDAGASDIKVIIKDAGRSLIRVIDNGSGMSETDARLSLERHATSKITNADDLFSIRTKGFRGEALASIAAIAQVEIKTRREDFDLGTLLVVEGSVVKIQEPCQTPIGTSISVKNLFYNVPARRNFLKSDTVEMRHIIDEFERVALIHEGVAFSLFHNDKEVFSLPISGWRQRVVSIMGKNYNERIAPVSVDTDFVKVHGFIGKPEFAKHTRGEQFFFLNSRFIRNPFFHHAVQSGFQGLLAHDRHPFYLLHIEVDPSTVDINIHPTKTEVKFQDEKAIYAIVHAAVRESIGKFNLSPSLDFNQEAIFMGGGLPKNTVPRPPEIKINPNYNPFEPTSRKRTGLAAGFQPESPGKPSGNWRDIFEIAATFNPEHRDSQNAMRQSEPALFSEETGLDKPIFSLMGKYIVTVIKSGLILVDIRRARERIFYEQFNAAVEGVLVPSQRLLFPVTMEVSTADGALLTDMEEDLQHAGFEVSVLGRNSLLINGLPADCQIADPGVFIERFLEQMKHETNVLHNPAREAMLRSLARGVSIRAQRIMDRAEMAELIDRLFGCRQPHHTPSGLPVVVTLGAEELEQKFRG